MTYDPERYPEHEKLHKIKDQSQTIGQFLEWTGEKGWHLAEYVEEYEELDWDMLMPIRRSITDLLAEYFGIDQNRLEAEKRQMLDEIRAENERIT